MTHQKKGFIALQRSILEWEWYNDIPTKTLFIHILLKANFKDKKWQGHLVKRGELITGRKQLSQETGLSEQQTKTALKKLQSTNEITIKATNRFSIVTLVNYGLYQDKKEASNQPTNQPEEQQTTNNQPTERQQATTTKNENNDNNDNNKKTKAKKYNDFHFSIASELGNFVKNHYKKNLTMANIKKWADDIRLLQEDLSPRKNSKEDIKKAMKSIIENTGKPYFVTVQSGSSFRQKFFSIEEYSKRENKQSKPPININTKEIDYGTSGKF